MGSHLSIKKVKKFILALSLFLGMAGVSGDYISDSAKAEKAVGTFVSREREIIDNLGKDAAICLAYDVEINDAIVIQDGKSHTLDLNGYELKKSFSSRKTDSGSVIILKNNSTLTIRDSSGDNSGKISGGFAKRGGGICVDGSSSLIMFGGKIGSNYANQGGAIYIGSGSNAILSNVKIDGNNGYDLTFKVMIKLKAYKEWSKINDSYKESGLADNSSGGGIWVAEGAECELSECYIRNNGACTGGGICNAGKIELVDCEVLHNDIMQKEYGGTQAGGGIYSNGTVVLNNVDINCNTDASYGGGICSNSGDLSIIDCNISDNSVSMCGGGVYADYYKGAKNTVFSGDNIIEQNSAKMGGGIYLYNGGKGKPSNVLDNIRLSYNYATESGGALYIGPDLKGISLNDVSMEGNACDGNGGAIISYSEFSLTDCLIRQNMAKKKGGGIYADFQNNKYNLTVTKTTIQENVCYEGGGGIWLEDSNTNAKIVLGGGKTIIFNNNNTKNTSGDENIVFKVFREIKIKGKFAGDSKIGVLCSDSFSKRTITRDYGDYNSKPIDTFFEYDNKEYKVSNDDKQSEVLVVKKILPSASGYKIEIDVSVTNDADDWDDSHIEVWCRKKNGVGDEFKQYKSGDITDYIDHKKGSYSSGEIDCGDSFPTYVNVYANFGGGLVIRGWEADVKVKINGVNCGTTHVKVKLTGNTKKKGLADNWIKIGGDKYPYIDDYEVDMKREINLGNDKTKVISITGIDQYGVEWKSAGLDYCKMENISFPGEDTFECVDGKGLKWKLDSKKKNECHNSLYRLSFKSGSNYKEWVEVDITVRFVVPLYLTIKVGNDEEGYKEVDKIAGNQKETIEVTKPKAKKGYKLGKTKKDGVCIYSEDDEGNCKITLSTQDVVICYTTEPIKYKIIFDKNVTDKKKVKGNMAKKSIHYDEETELANTGFTSKVYTFKGWNTKADGTGKSYKDGECVKNLSEIDGDEVTMYAQWQDSSGNMVTASIFSKGKIALKVGLPVVAVVAIVFGYIVLSRNMREKRGKRGNTI